MASGVKPIKPVDGEITEGGKFGAPRDTPYGKHAGVDYGVEVGTSVKASLDGVVIRSNFSWPSVPGGRAYGNMIVLYHGKNVHTDKHAYTLYAHLNERGKNVGEKVYRGNEIAASGKSGNVNPHLHFETIVSPKELLLGTPGAVPYGEHRIDPAIFFNTLFSKESEPLSGKEMDKFYDMITTDFRTAPRPVFLVGIPEYREVIKKLRGEYPPVEEKPPKVKLKFKNMFSPAFRSFFPSVELAVNGKSLGTIRTGEKVYELNVWV